MMSLSAKGVLKTVQGKDELATLRGVHLHFVDIKHKLQAVPSRRLLAKEGLFQIWVTEDTLEVIDILAQGPLQINALRVDGIA